MLQMVSAFALLEGLRLYPIPGLTPNVSGAEEEIKPLPAHQSMQSAIKPRTSPRRWRFTKDAGRLDVTKLKATQAQQRRESGTSPNSSGTARRQVKPEALCSEVKHALRRC